MVIQSKMFPQKKFWIRIILERQLHKFNQKTLSIQNFSMHGGTDLNLLLLPLAKRPFNSMSMTILLNEFCIPALLFKLLIKKRGGNQSG